MNRLRALTITVAALAVAVGAPTSTAAKTPAAPAQATMVASGLHGGLGSALGPEGAMFVAEPVSGEVARVDLSTGTWTTYATGLPAQNPAIGLGGVMDVAFAGGTLYALVTLVGPDTGGTQVDGIYRWNGGSSWTVVADIGQFAMANPPDTAFEVPTGVQFAMTPYRGGFLVTDGHHNRVYAVDLDGSVRVVEAFDDIVPTGLETWGKKVLLAEAGPVPHLPGDGRIVEFTPDGPVSQVAAGAPLLVDVERGRGHTLFGLSQGHFTPGRPEGSPADPDTGSLVRVTSGGFDVVQGGLDRPTSMEIVHNTAYVVTLDGEVWRIGSIAAPPCGH